MLSKRQKELFARRELAASSKENRDLNVVEIAALVFCVYTLIDILITEIIR